MSATSFPASATPEIDFTASYKTRALLMWPQDCDTLKAMTAQDHAVGLRDLRHHTSEVLTRVRHGEIIDITEHGRLIARIVPVAERQPTPILARLVESGRATLARRPGYRPRMRPSDGTDSLSETLAEMRDEGPW
jgi:prevent-host-death family protein